MLKQTQIQRRKRGVVLSDHGWQRLQISEQTFVDRSNAGRAYTLEQLGQRTGLSPNTITKVRQRRQSVDRQTLEAYFNTLGLDLLPDDYVGFDADNTVQHSSQIVLQGQVPLGSRFYIERPVADAVTYDAVQQPGALVWLRAPQQFGKTSLMARVVAGAQSKGWQSVVVNFQLADSSILSDLDRLLRWFCVVVSRHLQLGQPHRLADTWDLSLGANYNCTDYFERHLLAAIDTPLLLALDGVDSLFGYPKVAADFLSLLRAWHEKALYSDDNRLWQRLRLLVVHATEAGCQLDLKQSPFHVGCLIELPPFTPEQVQDLTQRYEMQASEAVAQSLYHWFGGSPYLTQLALHHLSLSNRRLIDFTQATIATDSLFSSHLRERLAALQTSPDLLAALKQIVLAAAPVELNPTQAFKLQDLGLVRLYNLQATPSCQLYRTFFAQVLPLY